MAVSFCISHLPDVHLIGVTDCSSEWTLPPRKNPDFEIILCFRGILRFTVGDRQYTLSPGDFLLIPPEETHSGSGTAEDPVGFYYLHFSPAGKAVTLEEETVGNEVRKAIDHINREYRGDLFFILPSTGLDDLFLPDYLSLDNLRDEVFTLFEKALFERNRLTVSSKAMISLYFSQLLLIVTRLYLQNRHTNPVISDAGELPRLLQLILQYIYDHMAESKKIADLCRELGVSQQYLNRIFAKYLHISPVKYINKLKITMAKDLMRETGLSIKQIAYTVGFPNAYYFSRLFHKTEGITPTDYMAKLNNRSNL